MRRCCAVVAILTLTPLAIPDQLVDRTTSRAQTYYDTGGVVHVAFADPYCPRIRAQAISAARAGSSDSTARTTGARSRSRRSPTSR